MNAARVFQLPTVRFVAVASVFFLLIDWANCQEKQASSKSNTASSKDNAAPELTGKALIDKSSYLLGYDFLFEFKSQGIEIDIDRVIEGLRDAASDKKPDMGDQEIRNVMDTFQRMLMEKKLEAYKIAADKNLREGEKFLADNRLKDGVKELESGLQYRVVKSGSGDVPKNGDTIKFHFSGSFIDGVKFESSGETPMRFTIGTRIMPALAEAFQRMKLGDKWTLFVPAKLAFGVQGDPPRIGPNQTLVYDLEVLEIVK